jgi:SNW domain-containing protein 1
MASLWLPAPTRIAAEVAGPPPTASASLLSTANNAGTMVAVSSDSRDNTIMAKSPLKNNNVKRAPSYQDRCAAARRAAKDPSSAQLRKSLFVPRSLKDFDDGGAFPEIHVAQYPRNMGNPHLKSQKSENAKGTVSLASQSQLLNVEVDADGKVSYDAVVTQGTNANNKLQVYTKHQDLRGIADPKEADTSLPTAEEQAEATERTQAALNSLLSIKISAAKPSGTALANAETSKNQAQKTQLIHYTPNPNAPGYNADTASQRVIQMVPAQLDPMMPPKHKHKKEPRGPADDPVPVLHAPPRKLTKEEAAAWNVPACVSNWKNTRGYTIPLDKRLAADGRGVRDTTTINPKFATLSESLYVAERQAREEVRMRANVQHRLEQQQKQTREDELRQLAMQARMERSGGNGGAQAQAEQASTEVGQEKDDNANDNDTPPVSDAEAEDGAGPARANRRHKYHAASTDEEDNNNESGDESDNEEDKDKEEQNEKAKQQRDKLRLERKRERERELRQEKLKKPRTETGALDGDRDVSEKIALGVHTGSGGGTAGGEIDSRLYNQSGGFSSGFGAEDEYNTFDKPLFDRGAAAQSIYKPTQDASAVDVETQLDELKAGQQKKFSAAPSKGFAGAEGPVSSSSKPEPRSAPVQFEKEK